MTHPAALASKRLVIFGCGYVGSAVARQARAAGMSVTALTRNEAKAGGLRADGIEVIVADLASESWHAQIGPAEMVLNCVSSGGGGISGYRQSYVEGMRSIVTWTHRARVGTLIYTSSTSVYPQSGGVTVDETASTTGAGETGRILLDAERLLGEAQCERWFVLRLAGIYGPGRHQLLDQVRAGVTELSGTGEHHLNLAHRDDICAGIWAAFSAPSTVRNEVFNLSDDAATTKAGLVRWLATRLGRNLPRFNGVATGTRRGSGTAPDRIISNAKARRMLGWRPQFPDFATGYEAILSA